jgi:hypothetical protein
MIPRILAACPTFERYRTLSTTRSKSLDCRDVRYGTKLGLRGAQPGGRPYPRERTSSDRPSMSEKCQQETSGCPAEPLVSYQINRQLSGWNLPPLMIRAFGAHCQIQTLSAPGGAPLDDARLGIVKHFTSVPYCSSITCRIRLAEPIGQRLSAWIVGTTFSAPSRAGTCI